MTEKEIRNKLKNIGIKLLTFNGTDNKCKVMCIRHKLSYDRTPRLLMYYKACMYEICKAERRAVTAKRTGEKFKFSFEESLSKVKQKHPHIRMRKAGWVGHGLPAEMKRTKSGCEFSFIPSKITNLKTCPCPSCRLEMYGDRTQPEITKEVAQARLKKRFPSLVIENFEGASAPMTVLNTLTGQRTTNYLDFFLNRTKAPLLGVLQTFAIKDLSITERAMLPISGNTCKPIRFYKARLKAKFGGLVWTNATKNVSPDQQILFNHSCGHSWKSTFNNVLHSSVGCPLCAKHQQGRKMIDFSNRLKENTDDTLIALTEYQGDGKSVTVGCKKCGSFNEGLAQRWRHWKRAGCPTCSGSEKRGGFSLSEIEWLKSMENTLGIEIQHALNLGQRTFKAGGLTFKPDGIHHETNTIFEFLVLGSYYHQNISKDLHKFHTMQKHGFNIVWITEEDWNKDLPYSGVLIGNEDFFSF